MAESLQRLDGESVSEIRFGGPCPCGAGPAGHQPCPLNVVSPCPHGIELEHGKCAECTVVALKAEIATLKQKALAVSEASKVFEIEADKEIACLRGIVSEAKAVMQEFVNRVDSGEVQSVRTYTKFKAVLA